MATAGFSKPSKWFSNKTFKLSLHRLRRPKPPPASPRHVSGEFREAFRRFDSDGDGRISGEELRAFFTWAGEEEMTAEEAERAVRDLDSNGDGLIDYEDFAQLMAVERDEGLRRAFEMFEAEKGSGCITPDGLRRVLGRLGDARSQDECAAMIRAYDVDGNGVLDFNEFHRMMS